jgi:hypothetical protein
VDLSRRLRLKSHPKMAAWERLIDSNNLNASSRKFPSFQVHSRLKMQREKTNNNNSSRDKETNREHSRIRSTNIEQKWKLLYFDAFIFWRTSCSHALRFSDNYTAVRHKLWQVYISNKTLIAFWQTILAWILFFEILSIMKDQNEELYQGMVKQTTLKRNSWEHRKKSYI